MTAKPVPDTAGRVPAGQSASRTKSLYCDTGTIVALVMGPVDPFFDDAMRFLSAARLGTYGWPSQA